MLIVSAVILRSSWGGAFRGQTWDEHVFLIVDRRMCGVYKRVMPRGQASRVSQVISGSGLFSQTARGRDDLTSPCSGKIFHVLKDVSKEH